MLLYFIVLAVPFAAIAYFHAGVAWGRRREGTDTLFAPATGTDFYETWFVAVPFYAVTVALGVIASATAAGVFAKRLTRAWLLVPAGCAAAWVVFFFYLAIAADGPFP
jgi:hypothetical protein